MCLKIILAMWRMNWKGAVWRHQLKQDGKKQQKNQDGVWLVTAVVNRSEFNERELKSKDNS